MNGIWPQANYADHCQRIKTQGDYQKTRDIIHVSAKVTQAFFSVGCFFSGMGAVAQLTSVLSGSSFIIHGTLLAFRVIETILCYDLAKISANIASIFQSRILLQTAKNHLEKSPLGATAVNLFQRIEDWSKLPAEIQSNTKSPKNFTNALTYGTIGIQNMNPRIESFLSKTK